MNDSPAKYHCSHVAVLPKDPTKASTNSSVEASPKALERQVLIKCR